MTGKKGNYSIRSVFLAVALLLAALTFAKVAGYLTGPARAQSLGAQVAALAKPDPNVVQPYLEETQKTAETVKKQNLFVKPPPKEHPVKQVDGILGDEILIGDKKYKVGDKIGDAKVVSIDATQVMIEWDGQTKGFAPLAAAVGTRPEPSARPAPPPTAGKAPEPERPRRVARPEPAPQVQAAAPEDDDPLAWLGVNLSPRMRALLIEKWNSASPEERERAMQEWNRMSDDQKEQAISAMERME
ncbi:MAG: hypothetical protein JW993_11845 [Sedimentisphaerales bacterium]|nr:hypothetical protein [Sedimentisphaerales bacterium]